MNPEPLTDRERVARLKLEVHLQREAEAIRQLPRAERRAATRRSLAHKIARKATRPQRRAFGGWAGSYRPNHPSVTP